MDAMDEEDSDTLSFLVATQALRPDDSIYLSFVMAPTDTVSKCAMLCSQAANSNTTELLSHSGTQSYVVVSEAGKGSSEYLVTHEAPLNLSKCGLSRSVLNSSSSAIAWSPHRGCTTLGIGVNAHVIGWDTRSSQ
ncbi:hypothetical protein Ciccas_005187 [Cichlidogyrus casuarinus]|uniref:Uncharacterized protein n=1 Tax=Cichlidogyrus casuarinus TaxID=1844966 RepID=A0ABD2QAB7_9PLAT